MSLVPVSRIRTISSNVAGITDGSLIPSGAIGELLSENLASGSASFLAPNVALQFVGVTIPAGIWDTYAVVSFIAASGTIILDCGIATTLSGMPAEPDSVRFPVNNTPPFLYSPTYITPTVRRNVTANTNVAGVALMNFSGGSLQVYGTIFARRAA